MGKRGFGQITRLPSKRYRARYQVDRAGHVVSAPTTFSTKAAAEAWLARERTRLEQQEAGVPKAAAPAPILREYGTLWLERRPLRPSTRRLYAGLWRTIDDELGTYRLSEFTSPRIADWHAQLLLDRPTARAHTYALLRTILGTAVEEGLIPANPARVRGGGTVRRARTIRVVSPAEIRVLEHYMPARLAAMVTLAAWCGLRFGEVAELRRHDVDLDAGTVSITRSVTRAAGGLVVGPPKTASGVRVVAIPPHVVGPLRAHMRAHVGPDADALLFPLTRGGSQQLDHGSSFGEPWRRARDAAGLHGLRFHDLRHTALTMAAQTGATTAELARRAGHSSLAAVAIYQHAAADRDRALAERLSALAQAVQPATDRVPAGSGS